ncbi:ankyrin repeat domain-containing protein [Caenimonas sedimenti]|uniref:Ankyrin repeat domain-containing protein n=2 Tax=Caenimonas sedimenti TaxID=2596921 RepID=A0A562ZI89_9BURK|nr:ankyrin repeat domain-containing protein [Caenimonas sedimenti]
MRNNMRFLLYLAVFIGFSSASAGSYEDYFQALKQDNPRVVSSLLQRGFDANALDPAGVHGLFTALKDGSLKVAEVLVEWPKTNVEWRSPKDESPLMMAALKGHTDLVRRLIERGGDVNKPGWTPLHYAATGGHVPIMELLLEHHAFIDAESPNKTTPLMMAAHYGTLPSVKLLLEAGADPTMRNQLGLSAIEFAQRANRKDAADLIAAAIRAKAPKGKW